MKAKLTVRLIDSIQPSVKDVIVWDTELAGFGCKVTPKGRRSYLLYYRTKDGQQRRPSLGTHGALRPEAAREIARRWLGQVAEGNDPSQLRTETRAAPTVRDLCDRYITEHAEVRKKASSTAGDRRLINLHIVPQLGAKKVAAVSRHDVLALQMSLRSTPYEANRVLALLSKAFSLAERWGLRSDGSNPVKNVDRFREIKRERYLTRDEFVRLWKALHAPEIASLASPSAVAAIKLLILTGRRLSEVLTMRWQYVDFDAEVLRLPDTKSGALTVSLGGPALKLLRELRAEAEALEKAARDDPQRAATLTLPFVIQGKKEGDRLVNLQKAWRRVRAGAGLNDLRLHDLRHSFASVGAGLGMSLPLLGRLLGHTQAATTARYAHLALDPVKAAANAIGGEMMRLIGNEQISAESKP